MTVKTEPLFPIVVLPFWSIRKAVVVENPEVEDETVKRGVVAPAEPATESFAKADVVPIPTLPVGPTMNSELPLFCISRMLLVVTDADVPLTMSPALTTPLITRRPFLSVSPPET